MDTKWTREVSVPRPGKSNVVDTRILRDVVRRMNDYCESYFQILRTGEIPPEKLTSLMREFVSLLSPDREFEIGRSLHSDYYRKLETNLAGLIKVDLHRLYTKVVKEGLSPQDQRTYLLDEARHFGYADFVDKLVSGRDEIANNLGPAIFAKRRVSTVLPIGGQSKLEKMFARNS